jgi:signal transduction histidine kinase
MKYVVRTFIIATLGVSLVAGSTALAETLPATTTTTTTETQQQRLATIKSKGDEEIARRMTALTKLTSVLQSAQKLTSSDKAALTAEITSTTSGLTTLKTKLDGETTLDAVKVDVQSMVTEYRVFALVMPKVHLIKITDDQIATETALTNAATKLQARLSSLKNDGKDVNSLFTTLSDMTTNIANAQKISTTIQSSVISLQPTDYDSNHKVLEGDNAQLKTAHADLVTARKDADVIVKGIAAL